MFLREEGPIQTVSCDVKMKIVRTMFLLLLISLALATWQQSRSNRDVERTSFVRGGQPSLMLKPVFCYYENRYSPVQLMAVYSNGTDNGIMINTNVLFNDVNFSVCTLGVDTESEAYVPYKIFQEGFVKLNAGECRKMVIRLQDTVEFDGLDCRNRLRLFAVMKGMERRDFSFEDFEKSGCRGNAITSNPVYIYFRN